MTQNDKRKRHDMEFGRWSDKSWRQDKTKQNEPSEDKTRCPDKLPCRSVLFSPVLFCSDLGFVFKANSVHAMSTKN